MSLGELPFISVAAVQFWNLISKDFTVIKLAALRVTWSGPDLGRHPGLTSSPPKQEGFPGTDNSFHNPRCTACRSASAKANSSLSRRWSGDIRAGTEPRQRSSPILPRRHFLMTITNFLLTKAGTGQARLSRAWGFKNSILWLRKCNFRWILEAMRSSSSSRKHTRLLTMLEGFWKFPKCWENKEL